MSDGTQASKVNPGVLANCLTQLRPMLGELLGFAAHRVQAFEDLSRRVSVHRQGYG